VTITSLDHATGYLAAAAGVMALAASQGDGRARYQQLSLARTAKWFTDTGHSRPSQPRQPRAESLLTEVPGRGFAVRVVRPPKLSWEPVHSWSRVCATHRQVRLAGRGLATTSMTISSGSPAKPKRS